MAKHSVENATAISDIGGTSTFLCCLEDSNVAVKEMAACGIGCLISKSPVLATSAMNSGAIALLLLAFQSNELQLKNIAALALGDLAGHSGDHARAVVDSTAVLHFARALNNVDVKLKVIFFTVLCILKYRKSFFSLFCSAIYSMYLLILQVIIRTWLRL